MSLIVLRHAAEGLAATVSFLCLTLLTGLAVLGLPDPGDPRLRYADRACRLAKAALDPHLPCLADTANGSAKPKDRDALWSLVKTACVPASYVGLAFPCESVDRDKGYALIKASFDQGLGFILTPTVRIPGIESLVSDPDHRRRLWLDAWEERKRLEQAANHKLDWRDIALAVNSKSTRSQDQFHIHLACVSRSLLDFLATEPPVASQGWSVVRPASLRTGVFVKLLPADAIKDDLFKMVFDEIPGGKLFVEKQTIVVAGVRRDAWKGFALIVTLEPASAEDFLARAC
jgi:CDP-diacylglycerol pyrophosphatase